MKTLAAMLQSATLAGILCSCGGWFLSNHPLPIKPNRQAKAANKLNHVGSLLGGTAIFARWLASRKPTL